MSQDRILNLAGPNGPSREVQKAAVELLQAFISQHPRAVLALSSGFKISISNSGGPIMEIHGSLDSGRSGLILPAGN